MTRGLFLRADADMNLKTLALIWRRVMGVLCGCYPAWQLDSFDCPNEKADPEGAYTSCEFMRWLDAEHYSSPGPLATRAKPCARLFATTRTISALPAAARCFAWMGGILRSTARTKMCLRRCTPTRNCGRCAIGSNTSPTRTTGGRRFASEAIFPAPVLTGRALSAIIKHTVRQSHSCGAPEN